MDDQKTEISFGVKTALVPYLALDGKAAEAMNFYQSIFGGQLTIQTFGDAFPDTPDAQKDRTMHALLQSDDLTIMASDTNPEHSPPIKEGNTVSLSIVGSDEAALTEWFNKLAEGGTITMPLKKQFWGDTFGMVMDKYGFSWMVNISTQIE